MEIKKQLFEFAGVNRLDLGLQRLVVNKAGATTVIKRVTAMAMRCDRFMEGSLITVKDTVQPHLIAYWHDARRDRSEIIHQKDRLKTLNHCRFAESG